MRREAAIERVGGAEPGAGEAKVAAYLARAQIEEPRRADIGKETDPGLGHREHGLFGRDPVGAVDRDPGAAAHGDAVKDGDVRLRVMVDEADDAVFLGEEHRGEIRVAGNALAGFVDRAHIAAGAKGAVAGAFDQYRMDFRVACPGAQLGVELPIHAEGESIQGLRAVQQNRADATLAPEQDVFVIAHSGMTSSVSIFWLSRTT